jgi:hypothetical protein
MRVGVTRRAAMQRARSRTALFSAARAAQDAYRHRVGEGNSLAIADGLTPFDEFAKAVELEEKRRLDEEASVGKTAEPRPFEQRSKNDERR